MLLALELLAVGLAVAYLLLAVRERIECWYAAFASTAIFLYLFWQAHLYMDAALQIFYLGMAIYGWWRWRHGGAAADSPLPITRWPLRHHLATLGVILVVTAVSGYLLQGTGQQFPYLDSFTTWAAVVTTFMVAHKVLENWLYWIVIDSLGIYIYLHRDLELTALLFALYAVIALVGWLRWRRQTQLPPPRGSAPNA